MPRTRVVLTGLGVLSPLGNTTESFWNGLLGANDGIDELTCLETSAYPTHRGGEVRGFDPLAYMSPQRARAIGRASQYALAASKMALADSALDTAIFDPMKVGVAVGTTSGEIQILEKIDDVLNSSGPAGLGDEHIFSQYPCGSIPSNIADEFGLGGPNTIFPTACAAGNYAIGWAFDEIRRGNAEAMLAGGVDPFSRIAFTGFNKLRSVAPERCQPFDKERRGMMVSEGAAILILETLDHATERGAHIYAEVLGYGLSCDAHHMTGPEPSGAGIVRALEQALDSCGVSPSEVDYVCAHGTGTTANDRAEAAALGKVFGELGVPVSSLKSMLGHTMGAASALEAVACALCIERGVIPPTINFETPDEFCPLDCVPNSARPDDVEIAVSNAFAFGGNNSALVLGKFDGGNVDG